MDAANSTTNAAGKRMAEAINPSTAGAQPPYPQQYGAAAASPQKQAPKKKSKPTDAAKIQARLEANRKAARESRRRKKVLVEELQRSVRVLLLDCLFVWWSGLLFELVVGDSI